MSLRDTRAEDGWRRLSIRIIWVDLAMSVLSVLPTVVAVVLMGVEASLSNLWPLLSVAAFGTLGAAADMIRWAFTRYRVTLTEIELRTGLFVRQRRSVRRDRIRSVDTSAKLRHRVGGLRVVSIGAGQQSTAGEAALDLDALARDDARLLRHALLGLDRTAAIGEAAPSSRDAAPGESVEVFATFRPWWVVYNMFSIWAYLMAIGLVWGGLWIAASLGVDLWAFGTGLLDWETIGWVRGVFLGLIAGGVVGAVGMGVHFLVSHWRFELARVRTPSGTYLRTSRGLFSTREVSRDESRARGLSISEPLWWRWMGMADTELITTGLSVWDVEQPAAILPRGPRSVAHRTARQVFGERSPFDVPLAGHPRAALRRRLWWATAAALAALAAFWIPISSGAAPPWLLWLVPGLWGLAILGAVIAYRALGHAITGEFVVVRSGLLSRATSALRRDAISTIAVRQSVLQQRLGLATVSAMTSAGWSQYEAPDVAAQEAVGFAAQAAPGLLEEFLVPASADEARKERM